MTGGESEDRLLDLIYAAALDPTLWESVLDGLADAVGGHATNLSRLSIDDGSGVAVATRVDPSVVPLYFERYAHINPFTAVSPEAQIRCWSTTVYPDEAWIDRDVYARTEFFNDFARSIGAEWSMVMRLALEDRTISTIHIGRPERLGRFDAPEIAAARRLQPHLIRAWELSRRFAEANGAGEGLRAALDRAAEAMVLTDADARVLYANRAGEALLTTGLGLAAAGGRLTSTDPGAAERLGALVTAATSRRDRTGGSLSVPVPGGRPLAVTITPVGEARPSLFADRAAALVSVADPLGTPPSAARLCETFGLTPAESRVALALLEGLSPRDIAERLDVSRHTVRVHLSAAFGKAGVHRQADLVRLLAGLPGAEP